MERTLKISRIYSQGSFQNITIEDTITNIPDTLALDERFLNLLNYLQLLNVERKYNKYEILRAKYRSLSAEEAVSLIEDEISGTKIELNEYIQGKELVV